MTLIGESKGWINHPAVKMWRGCEGQLALYGYECCTEWISRGYKDSLLQFFGNFLSSVNNFEVPSWIGDQKFHESHRSNLVRKFPEHYKVFWLDVKDDLPYIWPV